MKHILMGGTIAAVALLNSVGVQAAVSAAEAAKLKSELTPMGAEKAGNGDGSIPAWTGGLTAPTADLKGRRPDPFANEKPLFSITAANMAQYADKLTEGSKALLKRYPDTYRIDVYKTQRTMAAPQWVYDHTFKNATRASIVEGGAGPMPKGAFAGIPFPIPKTGAEVMWNHVLHWRGESTLYESKGYSMGTDGRWVHVVTATNDVSMPYYYREQERQDGIYWMVRSINSGPPIRAGEAVLGYTNLDETKSQAWVYLTGQRRTRKLPNACCDTPTPFSAGVVGFDEVDNFIGRMDRFDWKLVGKQEMYVPYNTNRTASAKSDAEVLGTARHLNPDHVRWELHRVWVVEATLKPGQRHTSPRSRYYVDEDSWQSILSDRWDAKGQLARHGFSLPMVQPEIPSVNGTTWGSYDLITGSMYVGLMLADQKNGYRTVPRQPEVIFTPESLAGEGVR